MHNRKEGTRFVYDDNDEAINKRYAQKEVDRIDNSIDRPDERKEWGSFYSRMEKELMMESDKYFNSLNVNSKFHYLDDSEITGMGDYVPKHAKNGPVYLDNPNYIPKHAKQDEDQR